MVTSQPPKYTTTLAILEIRTPADLIERCLTLQPTQPPLLLQLFAKMMSGELPLDPDLLLTHAAEIQTLSDEVYNMADQTMEMIRRCLQLQPGSSTRV